MDINQCPDKYYVSNAFKGTHKCDDATSYVSHSIFMIYLCGSLICYLYYFNFSVYLFWVEDTKPEDTNANANKALSILSKI